MPCAPLVEAEDLRGAYDAYARSGREIPLLAVVSFPYPVERALALDSEGVLRPKYRDSWHARSPDMAPAYHDAAPFSFSPAANLMNPALVIADRLLPYRLPRYQVVAIAEPEHHERAENGEVWLGE